VKEQLEMLDGAGHPFDLAAVRAGQQTPVYFGSAVNNFGIQLLLDGFLRDSVPPAAAQIRQRRQSGENRSRIAAPSR
jgi:peptide chain release factor 3